MDLLDSKGETLSRGLYRALVELYIKLRVEFCIGIYTELRTKLYVELCAELRTGLRAEPYAKPCAGVQTCRLQICRCADV